MAKEIQVTVGFRFSQGGRRLVGFVDGAAREYVIDSAAGAASIQGAHDLTVAAENLVVGEVAARYFYAFYNDGADTVEILTATGGALMLELRSGEWAIGFKPFSVPELQVKAGGAAATLRYWLVEAA